MRPLKAACSHRKQSLAHSQEAKRKRHIAEVTAHTKSNGLEKNHKSVHFKIDYF